MTRPVPQPVIRIDDLVLDLPAALGPRAGRIARLVEEKIKGLRIDCQGDCQNDYQDGGNPQKIETMTLADIKINARANDNAIAERIVSSLGQSLKERG